MNINRHFKIVLVGDSGVGKTSIINQYVLKEFDPDIKPTISVGYTSSILTLSTGYKVKIGIWDPAGQEKYRSLTKQFFRNIQGAILVYDISKKKSLTNLDEYWIPQLIENADDSFVLFVIGNKCDLRNAENSDPLITPEIGREFAKKHAALFVEASAKTSENVEEAFHELVEQIASSEFEKTNKLYNTHDNADNSDLDLSSNSGYRSYYKNCC